MIRVSGYDINVEHYPDGTQKITLDFLRGVAWETVDVSWHYESDEECMTLKYIVDTLKSMGIKSRLIAYYLPNARMDRIKSEYEVFTLKIFADFINSLGFENVYVMDPHSDVSLALIDRVKVCDPLQCIQYAIRCIKNEEDDNVSIIYFPDAGAMKRYGDMLKKLGEYKYMYGYKKRDWKTGTIDSLMIFDSDNKQISEGDLDGESILMIDDIISYGGTMYYSAKELNKCGAGNIYTYATHVENSILDEEKGKFIKLMKEEPKIVKRLYTTNSIYTGEDENIICISID